MKKGKKYKLKWQQDFTKRVSNYTMIELFEVFVNEYSEPDDHDGEWTGRGLWKRNYVVNEFRKQLSKIFFDDGKKCSKTS